MKLEDGPLKMVDLNILRIERKTLVVSKLFLILLFANPLAEAILPCFTHSIAMFNFYDDKYIDMCFFSIVPLSHNRKLCLGACCKCNGTIIDGLCFTLRVLYVSDMSRFL